MFRILAISGSLRVASTNTALLRYAQKTAPEGVAIHIVDISKLPLFNQDLETNIPESVVTFREEVRKADAVLFGVTENNYSVSAALKNALDWASRNPNLWAKKPASMVGSGGGGGTARAQVHLRQIAQFLELEFIPKPELTIRAYEPPKKFDNNELVDPESQERVKAQVKALVEFAKKWNPIFAAKI